MVDEEIMSMEDMEKILKDANLLEDNMSFEEVLQTCQIIKQSEISVKEENKNFTLTKRQKLLDKVMEDDFKPTPNPENEQLINNKDKFEDKLPEVNENSPNLYCEEQEFRTKVFENTKNFIFGFNDMPKSTGCMLDISTFTSKYVPFQNTTMFLEASLTEKAKIIYHYHSSVNKLKMRIAKLSFNPAPMPKQIGLFESRDYNLPINSEEEITQLHKKRQKIQLSLNAALELANKDYNIQRKSDSRERSRKFDDETYISRSGRHTKRKLYCDYDDDTSDCSRKKTKSGVPKKSAVAKSIKKQEDLPTAEVVPTEDKEMTPVDIPKPTSTKKLTNTEIMKRSSLFKDTPRPRTTRTELLFDKLVEREKEKEKSEKQMEKFNKTLEMIQENSEPEKDVIMVEDEEPFKVRVVPPIPGRKPIHVPENKTNEPPALDITIKPSTKSSRSVNNNIDGEDIRPFVSLKRNRSWMTNTQNPEESLSLPTSSKKATSNDVVCPICSKSFSQSKIEDHASACGD